VSLEDRRVHQSLLSELYHVNKKHDNTTTLYCKVGNNKLSSFVFILSSNDFGRLRVNENHSKWFGHVLTALGELGNKSTTLVEPICMYVCLVNVNVSSGLHAVAVGKKL
jgi:hypothetical protein